MELSKDYEYSILYNPSKANVVANSVNRKSADSLAHISTERRSIINELHELIDQVLHKALGTRLDFNTAFHPQTDGQSERTI